MRPLFFREENFLACFRLRGGLSHGSGIPGKVSPAFSRTALPPRCRPVVRHSKTPRPFMAAQQENMKC